MEKKVDEFKSNFWTTHEKLIVQRKGLEARKVRCESKNSEVALLKTETYQKHDKRREKTKEEVWSMGLMIEVGEKDNHK